jgi:hypothetical protein
MFVSVSVFVSAFVFLSFSLFFSLSFSISLSLSLSLVPRTYRVGRLRPVSVRYKISCNICFVNATVSTPRGRDLGGRALRLSGTSLATTRESLFLLKDRMESFYFALSGFVETDRP